MLRRLSWIIMAGYSSPGDVRYDKTDVAESVTRRDFGVPSKILHYQGLFITSSHRHIYHLTTPVDRSESATC